MEKGSDEDDFEEISEKALSISTNTANAGGRIGQEQFYDILTNDDYAWQSIIHELINTEQLDPWDIDIVVLTHKYLEKIRNLEEANFIVSSKVLLAAAFLLKIKASILLNKHIKSLDEVLFGREEKKEYVRERIEIDKSEIPMIYPRTPLPRSRKVTLQELIGALDKAIKTEGRRIKREISGKIRLRETGVVMPRRKINLNDKIKEVYAKIKDFLAAKKPLHRVKFSDIAGKDREERILTFIPLLHLEFQKKLWLDQERHFDEIWILLREIFDIHKADIEKELERELEIGELTEKVRERLLQKEIGSKAESSEEFDNEQRRRLKQLEKEFENPIADFFERI